ncbi:NADase-type glycan-binding domain-containing protein [Streptacidiphilus melanogenes]|uniref:NADase-type glycan-binding domain-containing protein n=1 Tax=Streptacidiphilus melanogenes TaxID=411235 RepID=UPI0005A9F9FF|nr:zinc ribbon domain-containing protein [Streptacidiphilus melanogenes]
MRRVDAAALVAPVERAEAPAADPAPTRPPKGQDAAARVAEEVGEQAPRSARARAVAVTKTAPSRRLLPGDLVCGACGEGNASTRRFCSRCGTSLVEAVKVKEPWWRRFVPRRGPRVVKLDPGTGQGATGGGKDGHLDGPGFDPKFTLRQLYRKARVVVGVAILCGGALYGAYPPFRTTVNAEVQKVKGLATGTLDAQLSPIHADSVTADRQEPGHPGLDAADELLTSYWLAPWSASKEPTLTFHFAHRVTLKKIILHSGASNAYIQDGRPSELRLLYSNGESFTFFPQDTSQQQTFTISHADLITGLQVQVGSVYAGSSGSSVAVAEIELFGLPL